MTLVFALPQSHYEISIPGPAHLTMFRWNKMLALLVKCGIPNVDLIVALRVQHSTSSSGSESEVAWGSADHPPSAPADSELPLDGFDVFQLDLLPDVPEGLESVDHLTAHLPLGI